MNYIQFSHFFKEHLDMSTIGNLCLLSADFKNDDFTISSGFDNTSKDSNLFSSFQSIAPNCQLFSCPNNYNKMNEYHQGSSFSQKRKYFTKQEDELLKVAAMLYGERSWNLIAESVPGRTPKQCRDRWVNYLQPSLQNNPWSKEEDKLLLSLVNTHGTHWTKMKSNFPNRSSNCIKNRWYWLTKKPEKSTTDKKIDNFVEMPTTKNDQKNEKKIFFNNSHIQDDYRFNINNINLTSNNSFYYSRNQNYYMINEKDISASRLSNSNIELEVMNDNDLQNINNNFINNGTNEITFNDAELMDLIPNDFFYELF